MEGGVRVGGGVLWPVGLSELPTWDQKLIRKQTWGHWDGRPEQKESVWPLPWRGGCGENPHPRGSEPGPWDLQQESGPCHPDTELGGF